MPAVSSFFHTLLFRPTSSNRALLATLLLATSFGNPLMADQGAALYSKHCVRCHGREGQGVENAYDAALYGDDSLEALTHRIEETMPLDDPEACTGTDARVVAEYIYGAFYSPEARQREGLTKPPRVDLTRLTSIQHRNILADLLLHFAPEGKEHWGETVAHDQHGLRGQYYQSEGMNKAKELKLERVDPTFDWDFGEGSPDESITADQFLIVWRGSIQTRHSGYHQFRVRTQNGARLYLNHHRRKKHGMLRDDRSGKDPERLIDAWVASGKLREKTARIYLLGERSYPIRLEYFKYKEKDASIQLQWKPPHGVWSSISTENLIPQYCSPTFVDDTAFPPDDRSEGYERGNSVSLEWLTASNQSALGAAQIISDRLQQLTGVDSNAADTRESIVSFMQEFASLAFRRSLTSEEQQQIGERLQCENVALEVLVRREVLRTLTSPHFLYPELNESSPYRTMSRLALILWDSMPDPELYRAAQQGELESQEQISAQARRMLADPRAKAKMRDFFTHWLELESRDISKDKQLYPDFNEAVAADLRLSLELFLEQVLWSETSDYRELLLADYLLLNERLKSLFAAPEESETDRADVPDVSDSEYEPVSPEQQQRAGVLTHPYLLSVFAYHNNTSPIHRGVFLTRNIIGRSLKPPPEAVSFDNASFSPDLTMRQKVAQLTRDRACMSCHKMINPLGFVLENYDAMGRWRTKERDKPIDASSSYVTVEGDTLELTSAQDLAQHAVSSPAAQRAFVTQLFRHLVKQDPIAYGPDVAETLREGFLEDNFNIQNLMVEIAVHAATFDRSPFPSADE